MKNLIFVTMMIAMTLGLASCEKDIYADAWDNGGTTPDLDTYELITEHVGFAIEGDILLDDHDAVLLKNGEEVERHAYAGEFLLSQNEVTLKRSIAEKLQNSTISYVDGKFDLAGTMMVATVTLQNCDKVYFNENGKTYCHPQFAEQNKGGVAALNLCSPQPDFLVLHAINGDILNGDVYFDDQKWLAEIIVIEDDVLGWETDDFATVTDRNTVSINAYETKNGVRTGRVETLTAGYSATLTAGAIITKTSQDILRLISTTATMSGSKAYFNYTLGSENFQGEWSWSASSNATFTLPDGQQTTKPVKADYSVRSTDLSINGNVYSNAAKLYADNIAVAEDVQLITVNVPATPDFPGYKPYNTEQWAVTRIYDTNALQSLVIWVFTLQNVETGAIVGGYKVLDGNGNTAALPTQLQNLSTPSFTSPYSMYFNTNTSAWEYGSLNHANKGTRNEVWEYLKWDTSDNQPMSVNISQDVADDIAWLEDNKVVNGNTITITYNGKKYTIVTE